MEDFNRNMEVILIPGKFLVVDEIMSMWLGKDGKYAVEGMPHVTKITRKPEGVGAEMKAVADGDTGCIIGVDLMEGAARMALRPFIDRYPAGTAVCLRLCGFWRGSGRIVIGDSWLGSVVCLIGLRQELGLFFMGMVKTAHRRFPKAHFDDWFIARKAGGLPRGVWNTLTSMYVVDHEGTPFEFPMYAVAWHDKTCKKIISNVGTTLPAQLPSIRHWTSVDDVGGIPTTVDKTTAIPRPAMFELFYRCFSSIDVNDHTRQGLLAIERTWRTNSWSMRVFGTLFGVMVTNAYNLHKYDRKTAHIEPSDFYAFVDELGAALIDIGGNRGQMILRQAGLAAAPVARAANDYDGQ